MPDKMIRFLDGITSPWKIALFFVFFILTYMLISGNPWGMEQLKELNGSTTPDMLVGYTPERFYEVLNAQGEVGRKMYLQILGIDFLFPAAYAFLFTAVLNWLGRTLLAARSRWRMLAALGLFAGGFDYLENILELTLLLRYPQQIPILAWAASMAGVFKFSGFALAFVAGMAGCVVLVLRRSASRESGR